MNIKVQPKFQSVKYNELADGHYFMVYTDGEVNTSKVYAKIKPISISGGFLTYNSIAILKESFKLNNPHPLIDFPDDALVVPVLITEVSLENEKFSK